MKRLTLSLCLVALLALAPGCGDDDKKTTGSSCSADGDCSGGVCFDSACHSTCTAQAECGEDELCVHGATASGEEAQFCNVAASYSGCQSEADCEALVAGPCDTIVCDTSTGLCGFTPAEDGLPCQGAGGMGRCEAGQCAAETLLQDVVEPEDTSKREDAAPLPEDTTPPPEDTTPPPEDAPPPPEDVTPPEDTAPPQDSAAPDDCVPEADLPEKTAYGDGDPGQVTVIFDQADKTLSAYQGYQAPDTLVVDKNGDGTYLLTTGVDWQVLEVSHGEIVDHETWFEWKDVPAETDVWAALAKGETFSVTIILNYDAEGVSVVAACWYEEPPAMGNL
jgi:hypothetical protein